MKDNVNANVNMLAALTGVRHQPLQPKHYASRIRRMRFGDASSLLWRSFISSQELIRTEHVRGYRNSVLCVSLGYTAKGIDSRSTLLFFSKIYFCRFFRPGVLGPECLPPDVTAMCRKSYYLKGFQRSPYTLGMRER